MSVLGQLHTAAHRAIAFARRAKESTLADRADALLSIALIDYHKRKITAAQLADFLREIAKGRTDAITLYYNQAAFRLPVPQTK